MEIKKILKISWQVYKENVISLAISFLLSIILPLLLLLVIGFIFLFPYFIILITRGTESFIKSLISNFSALLTLLLPLGVFAFILFSIFEFGYWYVVVRSVTKRKTSFKEMFDGIKIFWKRAIFQNLLLVAVVILFLIPLSFLMFISPFIFLFWLLLIAVLITFLTYWVPSIVLYDVGVIEGLKISVKKVKKNFLTTLGVLLIIFLIGIIIGGLEYLIPYIPTLLLGPLISVILVTACENLEH